MNLKNLIKKNINVKFFLEKSNNLKILKIPKIPSVISINKEYKTFNIDFNNKKINDRIFLAENGDKLATITLNYNYFVYSTIIKSLCNINISSYEVIGNVVHFNLKQEFLKYKFIIGKIVYDKTKYLVINKINEINNAYRNYNFEIIGGMDVDNILKGENYEKNKYEYIYKNKILDFFDCNKELKYHFNNDIIETDYKIYYKDFDKNLLDVFIKIYYVDAIINIKNLSTVHEENECKFYIDLKNVYWSSKLQEERKYLINELPKNKVIIDVFCGVGPLVIPLIKKGYQVYCNDLNKDAIKCLKINIDLNKLHCKNIYNIDAKEFLKCVIGDCYILNLPEHSLDYIQYIDKGLIFCYFFSKNDPVDEVKNRTGITGGKIKFIRKVSPCKSVYRLIYEKINEKVK